MHITQSRRDFLAGASLATTAGVLGTHRSLADEGPLETTTVRLLKESGICIAPELVAEQLLRAEGFTDVRYVDTEPGSTDAGMVAEGKLDFSVALAPEAVRRIDAGAPIVIVAGVHPGCYELFAHPPVNRIKDLKGRRVAIPEQTGYGFHLWLSLMAALCRARSGQGHQLGQGELVGRSDRAVRRRQGRCLPRRPAGAAGAARPKDRPDDSQHGDGSSMVAVSLLRARGERRLRPQVSGGD
jgi:NMT1/THI5 like